MRRGRGGLLLTTVAGVVLVACGGDGSSSTSGPTVASVTRPGSTATTPPATSGGFVAPPPCAAGDLAVWTAGVRVDQRAATADAVIRFAELAGRDCELVLTDDTGLAPHVEPNVVVEAGGWAELVLGQSGRECAAPAPVTSTRIQLLGVELTVPTAAVGTCGLLLTELLPVERPTEPCTAGDVTAVWTPAGFVVRNDGVRGCVLGALAAVTAGTGAATTTPASRPGPVADRAAPVVDALAPGDVVLFPTPEQPAGECGRPLPGGTLVLSTGTEVPVDVPPGACAPAGPDAVAWFGSPGGPLTDADPQESSAAWILELDAFGDPCVTVPVAPVDLVDGAPILSPATIVDGGPARVATWGDTSTNGVTQLLDVPVDAESPSGGDPVAIVEGPRRRAIVVMDGASGPLVDVAELDGSCVRRYVLPAGTPPDAAVAAAERWVG